MSEYAVQLILAAGIGVGFVAGLVTAIVVLLGWFVRTEAQDEGVVQVEENARLYGTGILSRTPDGTLEALSPSVWTIRRRRGMR